MSAPLSTSSSGVRVASPLTILMVDKYYHVKGGPERYLFEVKALLEAQGHRVIPFSMADEKNEPSEFSDCFVDHIDLLPRGGAEQADPGAPHGGPGHLLSACPAAAGKASGPREARRGPSAHDRPSDLAVHPAHA